MLWIFIVCSSVLLQTGSCFEESNLAFGARDGKGWGWGSETSSKFFDIALTALAFLSFGVFLLNLLLNALLFPSTGTTALGTTDPILTMITGGGVGPTSGVIVTGRSSGRRHRSKRAFFSPELDSAMSVEFLLSFVTRSIDTMVRKHECVPRVFCEGNRQSRVMGRGFQVLFPVVSISLSYLGKIVGLHDDSQRHMNAIVLGASEANCQTSFPKCR